MAHAAEDPVVMTCTCDGIYQEVSPMKLNNCNPQPDLKLRPCQVAIETDEGMRSHGFHTIGNAGDPEDLNHQMITDLLQRLLYKCEDCDKPIISAETIEALRSELRGDRLVFEVIIAADGIAVKYWDDLDAVHYVQKLPISISYRLLMSRGCVECRTKM